MESLLIVTLRDILCASLSLDDGLSAIQNLAIGSTQEKDVLFEVARAVEEIILRRPGLASAKLTELTVRLSFRENRVLPEMLTLLDVRYTNSFKRSEAELLPDIHAIPELLDILGQLSQSIISTINLNLRPLLPFLTDEVLMTLDAVHSRDHAASTGLALHEVHYLTSVLIEAGFFLGAELLLNRLVRLAARLDYQDLLFEVTFDYACVLTELGMFQEARNILHDLEQKAKLAEDMDRLASVVLQLGVNETRDETIPHETARATSDRATQLFEERVGTKEGTQDELSFAHLVIGTSILANGWREGVPQAIERLERGLVACEEVVDRNFNQSMQLFRILIGLGFAHGLLGDHENTMVSIEYLERAKSILEQLEGEGHDTSVDLARAENSLGWVCLGTDSDECWDIGMAAFQRAISMREELNEKGRASDLELLGSRLGLALSMMRLDDISKEQAQRSLREVLVQFVPMFPTDPRAFVEVAIATYNVVWLALRHDETLPSRVVRLLDDIDRLLADARAQDDSVFVHGVSLVVPYLNQAWSVLRDRASHLTTHRSGLSNVGVLMTALATAKMNLEAVSLGARTQVLDPVDVAVEELDPLVAQYWKGQTRLAETVKSFYEAQDFSHLATGLYGSAVSLRTVGLVQPEFQESAEFIQATCLSLADVLLRFALALENQYGAMIDRSQYGELPEGLEASQFQFILADDWLGLIKIADAYLQMVEQSEIVEAKTYLNAVFSNISRALKIMDEVSMVDRRLLSMLGEVMNRRYYLRG
ncbi:MAG: hypothetical protein ACE5H4_14235 [Candidatus Thorarchaeota archaeon]